MENALLVINYFDFMCNNVRDSFQDAAFRWGCDYREVTEEDYPTIFHPGSMKLMAFDFCDADRIFIIDADAIIRSDCPSPFEIFDEPVFMAVQNQHNHLPWRYIFVNPQIMAEELERIFVRFPRIVFQPGNFFNTGVCLVSRQRHADILAYAFEVFKETGYLQWYDQAPLNYAVAKAQVPVIFADPTWNYQFPNFGHWDYLEKYIYHFAGIPSRYDILPVINWKGKGED